MCGVKVNIRLLHCIVVYITVKKFPAGQPTAEATGPRLRVLPLRVLFCCQEVAPCSWLRRSAPTRNFVAGCGAVLDPDENIAGPQNDVARRPRFRRFASDRCLRRWPGGARNPRSRADAPS